MRKINHSFWFRNGLSIALIAFLIIFLLAQFFTGWNDKNEELRDEGKPPLNATGYLQSGHFIEATFENWESEFLQMAMYVLLTVSLRQKGSSESKKLDEPEEVDRDPRPHPKAPWPVNRGGFWLKIYQNSLSIAFALLFLLSFVLHLYGSLLEYNEEQVEAGLSPVTWTAYLGQAHFWFESFQNWQSEFLAVTSIVLLSIWLRQKGSPQSKPVDAPYDETGG